MRREFELAYYDSAVHRFNRYTIYLLVSTEKLPFPRLLI